MDNRTNAVRRLTKAGKMVAVDELPFNWRSDRHVASHPLRMYGGQMIGYAHKVRLELSLNAKLYLARENNKRCKDFINEQIANYIGGEISIG